MQKQAKITSKGQITIPQEIRQILRVKEGDTVIFETDEHGVRIRLQRPQTVFAEYAGIWREGHGKTVETINAELREERGHDS